MGNTVGRLSKVSSENLAYIAGFLDGDGSIMLQMHRRISGKDIFRVKTVICFYQDKRHLKEIEWIKEVLGCGYVYTRIDHICELRIEGFQRTFGILIQPQPYLKFKREQAKLLIDLIPKLQQKLLKKQEIASRIEQMRRYNYYSSQRNTLEVPVTTNNRGTG